MTREQRRLWRRDIKDRKRHRPCKEPAIVHAISFACVDCDVWVGNSPGTAANHTEEATRGLTQDDFDAGADTHDSFYVVNTTEGD